MKLRFLAAAIGFAIALASPGFASAAPTQSGTNVFERRTIEVDGSGEVRTSPDTADLNLAIDTQAKTAEQAAASNAALATKVIDALKSKLGDKGKVTTGGYSLDPQYDQRQNEKPRIIGYNAQNTVTVNTRCARSGRRADRFRDCGRRESRQLAQLQRQGRYQGAHRGDRDRNSRRARAGRRARVGARRKTRQGPQGDDGIGAAPNAIVYGAGDGDVGERRDAGRTRRSHCAGDGFSNFRD